MESQNKTIQIGFGILRPSVSVQLKEQGFKFKAEDCYEFEDCRLAIFNLSIQNLITEKQEVQIKAKLFRRIKAHVKKINELKDVEVVS